jgi:hypothetical protein
MNKRAGRTEAFTDSTSFYFKRQLDQAQLDQAALADEIDILQTS